VISPVHRATDFRTSARSFSALTPVRRRPERGKLPQHPRARSICPHLPRRGPEQVHEVALGENLLVGLLWEEGQGDLEIRCAPSMALRSPRPARSAWLADSGSWAAPRRMAAIRKDRHSPWSRRAAEPEASADGAVDPPAEHPVDAAHIPASTACTAALLAGWKPLAFRAIAPQPARRYDDRPRDEPRDRGRRARAVQHAAGNHSLVLKGPSADGSARVRTPGATRSTVHALDRGQPWHV
jgi:hypothetical protein